MLRTLAAQTPEFWPGPVYDPAIPTLQKVAGYAHGERISWHASIVRYFESLAAAQPWARRTCDASTRVVLPDGAYAAPLLAIQQGTLPKPEKPAAAEKKAGDDGRVPGTLIENDADYEKAINPAHAR